MQALAIILSEHRTMRMVDGALSALGIQLADGTADETTFHTVELIADYFSGFKDLYHDAWESEILFARIRERTDRGRDVLAELELHHQGAYQQTERLRQMAVRPNRGTDRNIAELMNEIALFRRRMDDHLRLEEESCFPLAREVLTDEDWRQVNEIFASRVDPLTHEYPVEAMALLRARITRLLPAPVGLGAKEDSVPVALKHLSGNPEAMLSVVDLSSSYGRIEVLHGVSIQIMPGQLVALVGANGAGKTTLLRCISGVQPVSGGSISMHGEPITAQAAKNRVRAGICQVPEGRHVFKPMSIEDNLRLGGYLRPAAEIKTSLDEVYALFPVLRERHDQPAGVLSGGQQQMLALGRALMGKPKLLLLDEPSMGLAPLVVAEIFRNIRLLRDAGITILLVEQNARAALAIADYAYVLETGNVALEGKGPDLMRDDQVRRAYLGM